jgi:hypothetical protein
LNADISLEFGKCLAVARLLFLKAVGGPAHMTDPLANEYRRSPEKAFTVAIFAILIGTISLCAMSKPARADCIAAKRYVAASEESEKKWKASLNIGISENDRNKLDNDATTALNEAKDEPCGSEPVKGHIEALEAWFLALHNAGL